MTGRERFINTMEYKPVDRVPNYEMGVWEQTVDRWESEGLDRFNLKWDFFTGEEYFGLDPKEFFDVRYGMFPPFDDEILEKTDRYEIFRDSIGIVRKALIEGTSRGMRSSMDQFLSFPVEKPGDFRELKKRYNPSHRCRYPAEWRDLRLPGMKNRSHVLVLGQNCQVLGFYWRCREWMGTENLSYAFFDQPELVHEMMEFIADYTIEVSKPAVESCDFDYVFINEDMSMKTGPLISPELYREFVFPHMRRLVDFYKSHGVRYALVDTDGNPEALLPLLMDAGVDGIWPCERAADMDPIRLRKKFGKSLRLWGGVDKREVSKGPAAIDAHLDELAPLIEEGGFIPTIDHTAPPDISLADYTYYIKRKMDLLAGRRR